MSDAAQALAAIRDPGRLPERSEDHGPSLDRAARTALGHLSRWVRGRRSGSRRLVDEANRWRSTLAATSDARLLEQVSELRAALRTEGFSAERVGQAFAILREQAGRRLATPHYDVQLQGGWAMLQGMVAEMGTGEGKTLAATLPAATAALAGIPVHIVTVNDYLAGRDAAWMAPLYEAVGLTVGLVTHDVSQGDRRGAYGCDVTYCTNKELVFDYLRDRLEVGERPGPLRSRLRRISRAGAAAERIRLRGLYFAIVDEADSVLIDEARTPLIISGLGRNGYEDAVYAQALELSEKLALTLDYTADPARRNISLTSRGREQLAALATELGGIWTGRLRAEDLVHKALTARHYFHRDRHYVVKDGKVQIVDEYTGRILPGRTWEGGLHQLIEAKEGCELTPASETLARISYQRFFRRYIALAGMTGTAREAAAELWSVYRLEVATVPPNRPSRRRGLPDRVHATLAEKRAAVVARVAEIHASRRPILIGTRTVAESDRLAADLERAGLDCRVLNARQDAEEAQIIAEAGRAGTITVATNMAGRGTDIKLPPGVAELGGLHVIATARHDARRIDRQLFGRCARQGDPGTYETFISLEDDLLRPSAGGAAASSRSWGALGAGDLGRRLAMLRVRRAQRRAERRHHRDRRDLLRADLASDSALAFSGGAE